MPKFSFFTQRFSKIRFSLLMVVAMSTLPIFALTLLNGIEHRNMMKEKGLEEAKQSARLVANELDHLIEDSRLHLKILSQLSDLRTVNPQFCSKSLTDLSQRFPQYSNLQMVDSLGTIRCRAERTRNEAEYADPTWLQDGLKTRGFFVREVQAIKGGTRPGLIIGSPVFDSTGDPQYILVATIQYDWLKQFVNTLSLPAGSTFTLINEQGVVLSHNALPDQSESESAQPSQSITSLASDIEGNFHAKDENGVDRLYGYTSLQNPDVVFSPKISIGIPTNTTLVEADQLLLRSLEGVSSIALLAVGVTWLASNRLLFNKIHLIIESMQRFSAGEMTARTRLSSNHNEIDYLGMTFDQMADFIDQKRQEGVLLAETLSQSEKKFRTLAETAPAAIFIYRGNHFLYVNSASQPITGLVSRADDRLHFRQSGKHFDPEVVKAFLSLLHENDTIT